MLGRSPAVPPGLHPHQCVGLGAGGTICGSPERLTYSRRLCLRCGVFESKAAWPVRSRIYEVTHPGAGVVVAGIEPQCRRLAGREPLRMCACRAVKQRRRVHLAVIAGRYELCGSNHRPARSLASTCLRSPSSSRGGPCLPASGASLTVRLDKLDAAIVLVRVVASRFPLRADCS